MIPGAISWRRINFLYIINNPWKYYQKQLKFARLKIESFSSWITVIFLAVGSDAFRCDHYGFLLAAHIQGLPCIIPWSIFQEPYRGLIRGAWDELGRNGRILEANIMPLWVMVTIVPTMKGPLPTCDRKLRRCECKCCNIWNEDRNIIVLPICSFGHAAFVRWMSVEMNAAMPVNTAEGQYCLAAVHNRQAEDYLVMQEKFAFPRQCSGEGNRRCSWSRRIDSFPSVKPIF